MCSEHIDSYLEILKESFSDLFYTSLNGNVALLNSITKYERGETKDPMMHCCVEEHQDAKLHPTNPLAFMPSLLRALVLKYASLPVISEHVEGNFYIVKKMHPANLFVNRVRQLKLKRNLQELIELNVLSSYATNLSKPYKKMLSSSTEFFRLTQRIKLRKTINKYPLNLDNEQEQELKLEDHYVDDDDDDDEEEEEDNDDDCGDDDNNDDDDNNGDDHDHDDGDDSKGIERKHPAKNDGNNEHTY